MTCAEFEVLYCDYVDGLLRDPEKSELDQHISTCPACAELAGDVSSAVAFIEKAEAVEPPAELLTRIMHDIPSVRLKPERHSWLRRTFGGMKDAILQPRFAMGMAMTMLSFSMLAYLTGIKPHQLRPSDLAPAKIWSSVEDRAHTLWDHAVKYYDNMRLVIQVQSRLKEFSEQDQARQRSEQQKKATAPKEQKK